MFLLVLLGRSPHRLTAPTFWAEDGRNWYAEARNEGSPALLLRPYGGYLNVGPRLAAQAVEQLDPVEAARAFFVVWLAVLTWFASIVWRRRHAIGPAATVAVLASLCAGAYQLEVYGNLTNLQWYAAVVLVVLGAAAASPIAPDEVAAVIIIGLSSPLVLIVALALAAGAAVGGRRPERTIAIALAATALAQGASLATAPRSTSAMAISVLDYPTVLGAQVGMGGMLGLGTLARLVGCIPPAALWALGLVILGILARGAVPRRRTSGSPGEPKGLGGRGDANGVPATAACESAFRSTLCGTALLVILAVFVSPIISDDTVTMADLLQPLVGCRYWFLPALAVRAEITRAAWRVPFRPAAALAVIAVLGYGTVTDYRVPAMPDTAFRSAVARFRDAPPGTLVEIPISPDGWRMRLRR